MSTLGLWVVSHGLGAVSFSLLFLFLLLRRHESDSTSWLLLLVCLINSLWCLLLVLAALAGFGGAGMDVAETIRDGAWLALAAMLLPATAASGWARVLRIVALGLPVVAAGILVAGIVIAQNANLVQQRSAMFVIAAVGMTLWGLILVEQAYRSGDLDLRWQRKHLCVALVLIFAYDFLMYSYLLVNADIGIAVEGARGAVNAMVVPLIAVSAARRSGRMLRLSHRAAFHASALILAGLYLLLIASGGAFVRIFGGTWGQFLGVLLVIAMLLLLAILVFSGRVRAILRVQVHKHFLEHKYDYRSIWLELTDKLSRSEPITDPYLRSLRTVADLVDCPGGALWLRREGRYVCVTHWNMSEAPEIEVREDEALPLFLQDSGWIVDIEEYGRDTTRYGNLELPQWLLNIRRGRLVVPLFVESKLCGFMLLAVPRAELRATWEDFDLLKTVGHQVGSFLQQQENHRALAQAHQFEAFNRLTTFLMHDLKNITAQQKLVIDNAEEHKNNPEFVDDMILTVKASVKRMQALLDQLQRTGNEEREHARHLRVAEVVSEVVDDLRRSGLACHFDGADCPAQVYVNPERCAQVLRHVIRNAADASAKEDIVGVKLSIEADSAHLAVIDSGEGMSPEFVRQRLFQPFDSTKASRGMGIGAYQTQTFARAAGGRVEVDSTPGEGTTFTIVLPLARGNGELRQTHE